MKKITSKSNRIRDIYWLSEEEIETIKEALIVADELLSYATKYRHLLKELGKRKDTDGFVV